MAEKVLLLGKVYENPYLLTHKEYKDMKYSRSKEAGNGTTVYEFVMNREELEIVYQLVMKAHGATPRLVDTIPLLGRLRNMQKVIFAQLKEIKRKK